LDYGFFAPEQGEWAAGERRVFCAVVPWFDDSLHGSVYHSHR
jgi:hypothetical protein